jgi:hypothetical protein
MYINGLKWIIVVKSGDEYNLIYGEDINDLTTYKILYNKNFQKICFTNDILLLINKENHLYYDNNFSFSNEVLNPKLISNTISIKKIETLENKFYILDNNGNLYSLLLKYSYSEKPNDNFSNEFSKAYSDKIRGFNISYTS